ncbi:MAG TPA: EamA family transporter RarD [Brevundimonas sp.]
MTYGADGRPALISAVACYTLWGFLPLLFMTLGRMGFTAEEILAQRTAWSLLFAGALVLWAGQARQVLTVLATPKLLGWLALSSALIAVNWGLYVWATTHHSTLEASLGYYINPLFNMVVGLWLFRERMDRWGWIAIALAGVGVLFQAAALGRPPWISLALAFSFCAYGVIRKRVAVDAQAGLMVECLLLAPFGIGWVVWLQSQGLGHMTESTNHFLLALLTGPGTVIPLALFAWAARRLPLSTIGFIQFLAPTLQFGVGVWSGEPFTLLRAISFAFIWLGAMVFAGAAWFRVRAERRALADVVEPV